MLALAGMIAGNRYAMIAIAIVLAASLGFAKGWSVEHDAKVAAIATQDAAWRQAIEKANRDAENDANARVEAALNASAAIVPVGPDRSDAVRLCNLDPNCRDQHQQNGKSSSMPRPKAGALVHR
jgi:hypothetical protein